MKYYLSFLFILGILCSKNNIEEHVIYYELNKVKVLDPYYYELALNKNNSTFTMESINAAYRFSSLFHETLFEWKDPKPAPNFVQFEEDDDNRSIKIEHPSDDIKARYKIKISNDPKIFIREKFHDDSYVEPIDIEYSIKYALYLGRINKEIFKPDNTTIYSDDNSVTIDFKKNKWQRDEINKELFNVIIFPHEYVKQFCDQNQFCDGECNWKVIENKYSIDDNRDRTEEYFSKIVGAGPYKLCTELECLENKGIQYIDYFNEYRDGSSRSIKRFGIMSNPDPSIHASQMSDGETNLILNMTSGLIQDLLQNDPTKVKRRMKDQNINILELDHSNPHLKEKKFREALSYILNDKNKKKILRSGNLRDGRTISGPMHTNDVGYDTAKKNKKTKKDVSNLLSSIGYKKVWNESARDSIYKHNSKGFASFDLIYFFEDNISSNQHSVTSNEKRAIRNLCDRFKGYGVLVEPKERHERFFKEDSNSNDEKDYNGDMRYIKISANQGYSLKPYFHSKGDLNWGNYSNTGQNSVDDKIDKDINCFGNNCVELRADLFRKLSNEVAALYLWQLSSYYVVDTSTININSISVPKPKGFFTIPETWRMKGE